MGLEAIFFDLDDTLVAYSHAERIALAASSAIAALHHPTLTEDALHQAVHRAYIRRYGYGTPGYALLGALSVDHLRRDVTEAALTDLGICDPALSERLRCAYVQSEAEALALMPGAMPVLEALRQHFWLGVITNGPSAMQRAKIDQLGIGAYFDTILVDTEFGCPKPDRRIFEQATCLAGYSAADSMFVGDSVSADIAGAHGAGWISVWLNPKQAPSGTVQPTYEVRELTQLLTLPPIVRTMKEKPRPGNSVRTKGPTADNHYKR